MSDHPSITLSDDYIRAHAGRASVLSKTRMMMRYAFDIVSSSHTDSCESETEDGTPLRGFEIVRHNLSRPNSHIDVNARITESGATLLHAMNSAAKSTLLVHDLIAHGANLNATNEDGDTPLHLAVHDVNATFPFDLLEAGASVQRLNHGKRTALDCLQSFHDYQALIELIGQHDHEQRILGRVQTAYDCLTRYQESGQWHLLNREEALLLANIDAHWQAFEPSRWREHEAQALKLIGSLPPFLQEELAYQIGRLQRIHMPEAALEWTARMAVPEPPASRDL